MSRRLYHEVREESRGETGKASQIVSKGKALLREARDFLYDDGDVRGRKWKGITKEALCRNGCMLDIVTIV